MSKIFKSKAKLTAFLLVLLLIIAAGAWSAVTFLDLSAFLEPDNPSLSGAGQPAESGEGAPAPEGGEEPETAEVFAPQEEEPEPEPAAFNIPSEMRGVYITPGIDILKSKDFTEAGVRLEIDRALDSAESLTMNAVIIDTVYYDKVLYHTADSPAVMDGFDMMEYLVEGARARDLYVYAIFDMSFYRGGSGALTPLAIGTGQVNRLSSNMQEFAAAYRLDGVLLDGYLNRQAETSYIAYLTAGGAIGYDNFMRQTPAAMVETAVKAVRKAAPGTQVGLLADAVWANKADNEEGSLTNASFTALEDGNADTKAFVESGLLDFVAVKAFSSITNTAEPFMEVVAWWGGVAQEGGIPLYVVHASGKICTEEEGWQPHDQLARQVIEAGAAAGYSGSVFNNLQRLVENPKDAAAILIKYYNKEVDPQFILTELEITKPEKTTYTTQEPAVTFTGASDPTSELTLNGEEIERDNSGYFTLARDLKGGVNTFTFEHKEKKITYQITREILVLKEVAPVGELAAEGSMTISISALAYQDAEVFARVGGASVPMQIDDTAEDEADRDSNYRLFVGEFTVPAAAGEVQNLGAISVTASWEGETKTLQGATVRVNKKKKIEDGVPVVVVADQARTYPPNTVNNIPNAGYYPLPRGAMDYAVGDEIVYTKDKKTYRYFVLSSGLRVESKDIQAVSEYASGNVISGIAVSSEGRYTYVTVKTAQKVSYSVKFQSSGISFIFHNTVRVPADLGLDRNPLFTKAGWNGEDTLTLSFVKQGAFMGYKGYYDSEGNLVLRFNNPLTSLSGARVVVDPGHGGADRGAEGFLAKYPEKVLNLYIAQMLADELESRGASVLLLDTSAGMSLEARVAKAEAWNADFFVSVHNNTSSVNPKATGTEVYYFYPYAYNMAVSAAKNVSGALGSTNRGPKYSYFHVTLSSQVPSVLVECGFLTNKNEYEKLLQPDYQQQIAAGIANALSSHIKAVNTGVSASGETQSVGGARATDSTGDDAAEDSSSSAGSGDSIIFEDSGADDSIAFEREEYVLAAGQSLELTVLSDSGAVKNSSLKWKSGNSAVAGVTSSGVVTAKKTGSAEISATTEDGDTTIRCMIYVEDGGASALESFTLSQDTLDLTVGEKEPLEVLPYPGNLTGLRFEWKSSDTSVAKVDQQGNVTAAGEGEAVITATYTGDRTLTASCEVTVD